MGSTDQPKENCGFFTGLFGGASGGDSAIKGEKCLSCGSGMSECSCNSILKDHLKSCCGYGTLPKLIEKCEETPGYRNPADITTSSCAIGGGGKCGAAPAKETCAPPPPPPPTEAEQDSSKKCSGGGGKVQCPPMPPTDCQGCKPAWMSCPPSFTVKTYSAPENDRILPLSSGGRLGGGCGSESESGKCGSCGTDKGPPGLPKISLGCPMNKARCPGLATQNKDEGGSIFSKIAAFFKGK